MEIQLEQGPCIDFTNFDAQRSVCNPEFATGKKNVRKKSINKKKITYALSVKHNCRSTIVWDRGKASQSDF